MPTMLKRFLGLQDTGEISSVAWHLRLNWPRVVLLVAALAAIGYVVYLYRKEQTLRPRRRVLLGVLRGIVIVMILTLLFEPVLALRTTMDLPRTVLVLTDFSDSMNMPEQRTAPADQRAAALALGRIGYDQPEAPLGEELARDVSEVTRIELAKALLKHPSHNVFEKIAETYRVRHFAFGEKLRPAKGEGETGADAFRRMSAADRATRLGTAMEEALERFSGTTWVTNVSPFGSLSRSGTG